MSADALRRFALQRIAVLSLLVACASALSLAGRWHWLADLFAHFVPHYFVAASILFGLHLWLRQFPWAVPGRVVAAGNGALLSRWLGIPIDLTLVSRDIQVSARDAGLWLGSNHWPVLTTVTLR